MYRARLFTDTRTDTRQLKPSGNRREERRAFSLKNAAEKMSQKSKMLMTFEILVMRRLMRQIGQNANLGK